VHTSPVSIGITTYNRAHLVTRAIDSVLAQDYPVLDVVVVDDGSTDGTLGVLQRYDGDPRVRVIALGRNGGIPVAKNAALDALTGEFGGLLDSDDELLPGAIRSCVEAFQQLGDAVSQVFGHCVSSSTGAATGYVSRAPGFITYEDGLCDRFGGEHWHLFRRADLGSLRFHAEALTSETYVWHAMLRQKPAYHVGAPLRLYHQSGDDRISSAAVTARLARGRMMAYRVYLERFGDDVRAACPRRYSELAQELAKWESWCGERRRAVRTLISVMRAGPARGFMGAVAVTVFPAGLRDAAYRWRATVRPRKDSAAG